MPSPGSQRNDLAKHWGTRHQQSDLKHVLHRSVELTVRNRLRPVTKLVRVKLKISENPDLSTTVSRVSVPRISTIARFVSTSKSRFCLSIADASMTSRPCCYAILNPAIRCRSTKFTRDRCFSVLPPASQSCSRQFCNRQSGIRPAKLLINYKNSRLAVLEILEYGQLLPNPFLAYYLH